jgi:phosphoesterase RecJ-like protein
MALSSNPILPSSDLIPGGPAALLDEIVGRMRAAQAVLVIGHVRPDGDCIGSLLGVAGLLEHWGIAHALVADEMPENGYGALRGFERIASRPDPAFSPDLVVFVDCATLDRGLKEWQAPAPIINIDHHGSNTRYGQINWIDPTSAATGEMIFSLYRHARVPLTPHIAESLLIALTTDTGSFRFSNTGPRQHRIAAELIEAGAVVERVAQIAYASNPVESTRLTGYVLRHLRLECGGKLAWSEVRQSILAELGGTGTVPENLADSLRSVRGVKVAVLFHELTSGGLRVNLRSTGEFNVGQMAAHWGGGGHPGAAGVYLMNTDYERDRDRILAYVMGELERHAQSQGNGAK